MVYIVSVSGQLTTSVHLSIDNISPLSVDFAFNPPQILPPVYLDEQDDALLFKWESDMANSTFELEYELIISTSNGLASAFRTKDSFFKYDERYSPLEKGQRYKVVVNTYITTNISSTVVSGESNSLYFEYAPICTAPKGIEVEGTENNGLKIQWSGTQAVSGLIEYWITYWSSDQKGEKREIQIKSGNSAIVSDIYSPEQYNFEIKKVCYWYDGSIEFSEPVAFKFEPAIQEVVGQCGDAYIFPPCNGPFLETGNWQTLEVGGFTVTVLSNNHEPTGGWTGIGRVLLPFGTNKYLRVKWTKVNINAQGKICGTVKGISDVPPNLPDLNPAPAIFGDDICQTTPSNCDGFNSNGIHCITGEPWDQFGFNPSGQYVIQPPYPGYEPGMPYDSLLDPNGFDANGIHFETQSLYGPNGCSQSGFDSLGNACNPDTVAYYWLQNAGEEATALYSDVQDSILVWIQQALANWQNTYQANVDQTTTECEGIRTTMNGLIEALDYSEDRELIFGQDDKYFATGMWKNFTSEPKPLNAELARNADQILLETKHSELYRCDKKLSELAVFKAIVDSILLNNGATNFEGYFEDLILGLSEEDAEYFSSNHDSLQLWLNKALKKKIQEELCNGLCEANSKINKDLAKQKDDWSSILHDGILTNEPLEELFRKKGSMASVDESIWQNIWQLANVDTKLTSYLNGDLMIDGIERAFYVEAIGLANLERNLLTDINPELMPINISNLPSDGRTYNVWLDNIEISSTGATLDAYFILEFPNSGKKIAFSALSVPFSPSGLLNVPFIKLQLANNAEIRLNNATKLTLKATPGTYVLFDCTGYGGIGVDLEVEVCRKYVKPVDPSSLDVLPDPERVHTQIQLFWPTIDEIYFEVNIDPFVVTGLEDYKWLVNGIVVDFSDTKSPNFPPPDGYISPFVNGNGFSPLWRGVYMANLSVRMPNQFNGGGAPLTVGVQRVLIDNMGVSGKVFATPLLPLDQGNAGGWAFSVDSFTLTVLANQPVNAGFKGRIHVPMFSGIQSSCNTGAPIASDCFSYNAFIEPSPTLGHAIYRMTVNTGNTNWCVNMWKSGEVKVNSGSQIKMEIENGEFFVEASLSGTVKITDPLSSNIDIKIPTITFENLLLKNHSPYFTSGTWGFPAGASGGLEFGGFGINITKIQMKEDTDAQPMLSFELGLKLADDNIGLAANAGFSIKGQINTIAGKQRWVYQNFEVNKVTLDGHFPGVDKIAGTLMFYEADQVYGTGWRGGVKLSITKLAEVSAVAQFGRMKNPDYKYFFVDALACLDKGFGGALKLKGFGGGVYYHMNRPAQSSPLGTGCTDNPTIPSGIGQSLSGLTYTPDNTKGLGIKATVALASAGSERTFNGNATLELLFDSEGGLNDLWIYGNARFMETPVLTASTDKVAPANSAVGATLDIHLDFENDLLHGELDVYMNVGGGTIRGKGTDGLMAHAIIHVENKPNGLWFIKIGTPTNRAGVIIDVPLVGGVDLGAYLQIGKNLDPMPPIPNDIAAITGAEGSAGLGSLQSTSNRSGLSEGNGFLFGADASIGSQKMEFLLVFYAGIRARLGFDIALLNYGENAVCSNTGAQLGINGWYASGQVYAGLWGNIGMKVKVFGKRKEFNIMDVALAASLQASLPNPFWAKGAIGAKYDLLGGLIKGQCDFQVTIGEKCQIAGADNPLSEINIVQRVSPENGSKLISTAAFPEVFFNFPMGDAFTLSDPNGTQITYHAVLESAKVLYYGVELSSTIKWANDKRSLIIEPEFMLPNQDTIEIVIKSHVDSSGIIIYEEERVAQFTTGPGLSSIPEANVYGSYPYDGQFNFFPDQLQDRTGYIMLKRPQRELFMTPQNKQLLVRYNTHCGQVIDVPLEYDYQSDRVEFEIPQGFFIPGSIYRMQVILKGKTPNGNNNGNSSGRPGGLGSGCSDALKSDESLLYTAYFRVSQYATFGAKLAAWNANKQSLPYVDGIIKASGEIECFDQEELGLGGGKSLLEMKAMFAGNSWYNQVALPKVYDLFNAHSGWKHWSSNIFYISQDRKGDEIGTPPVKAVYAKPGLNASPAPKITQTHWTNNGTGLTTTMPFVVEYTAPKIIQEDYLDLMGDIDYALSELWDEYQAQLTEDYNNGNFGMCETGGGSVCEGCSPLPIELSQAKCNETPSLPDPSPGEYKVLVRYRTPGVEGWYSTEQMIILNKN
ncbi:MAG: hypothetical protein J0M29_19180 [Chitinophagales bacterium]|nr:hypothetical protein [Chitinophagales bacterium]